MYRLSLATSSLLASAAAMITAGPALGADEADHIEEITVTATRTARPVFTTPSAVSVVDAQDIDVIQPLGYRDIFEAVPGVEIQGGSRRIAEEPNIRGFLDKQVVVRLDGARQNLDLAHRGRFFVDPDLVKRVEVLRGSASALYGSGALGGVISLETKDAADLLRPDESFGGRLKFGYQSNGAEFLTSAALYGRSGRWDAFTNLVYREIFEDLEDGAGAPILDSQDRLVNGLFKLGFEPLEHHRIEFTAEIFNGEGENPTNASSVSRPTTVVDRNTEQAALNLNYRYNDPGNPWVNLSAVGFFTEIDISEDRFFDDRLDNSHFESYGFDIYNTSRLAATESVNVSLTYGFEIFGDEQSGSRDGADRSQFPDAELQFTSLHAQAEVLLFDRLSIVPGVRWDKVDLTPTGDFPSRDESEFTPRVAVGFEPTDGIYLWGSYAEAFRAPSLTELFADGVHFSVPLGPGMLVVNEFIPGLDLAPEQADTFEVGARFARRDLLAKEDELRIEGSYYHSDIDNFVDQVVTFISGPPTFVPPAGPLVFPGTTVNRNVDARIKGVEAEVRYESERVLFSLAGHVVDGLNKTTSEGLANIPQNRLTIGLQGKLPEYGLRAGGRLTLVDDRDDVPEGSVSTEAYETVDLFINWAPTGQLFQGASMTLGIDNLLDENYSVHPTVIRQPGRSVRLSISYKFGG
ncbi:MAG: TonB-dependent hemoglobin/transferrin/lactoferrin family receptor [Sphingomonadales bacterium]